jgi:peptide chain release factor subunit 3
MAKCGENVLLRLKGIEEEEVQDGFVLSGIEHPCRRTTTFEAQVAVMDLLEHKPLLTIGYDCVLHVHVLAVECTIIKIVAGIDKKTGQPSAKVPRFLKSNDFANVRIQVSESIAVESFKDFAPLGRFTLRDEGKTIAIGKITKMKDV